MISKLPLPAAFLICLGLVTLSACAGKKTSSGISAKADSGYYPLRNFLEGQVRKLYGLPITVERVAWEGGRFDSSLLPTMYLDWSEVIPAFMKADISAPEFLGKYQFSNVEDNLTATRTYTYTATRPDLFTRTLQIHTDMLDYHIKALYIETKASNFWKSTSQKLLCIPGNIIQIQESSNPLIGSVSRRRLEYRFPRESSDNVHIEE